MRGGNGVDTLDYSDFINYDIVSFDMNETGYQGYVNDTVVDKFENIITSSGADKIFGNSFDNMITLGDGNDEAYGLDGNDLIDGGAANDIVYGQVGNDILTGGLGNDHLIGGAGDDVLNFGLGQDNLWGGAGADVFAVESASNTDLINIDVIHDFDVNQDILDLSVLGISVASVVVSNAKTLPFGFNVTNIENTFSVDVLTGTGELTTAQMIFVA